MLNSLHCDLQILKDFLRVGTPNSWLEYAAQNIPLLLIDHAHCERKAATTAINFISKYPEKKELIALMSPLAREELLHFEKVMQLLEEKNISWCALAPSSYASHMHNKVTSRDNLERLRDQLIIGAIIEARSCERFAALMPYLEEKLAKFYGTLLRSEARHFENYLSLAKLYGAHVDERIDYFLKLENEFLLAKDPIFRFHSGIPVAPEKEIKKAASVFKAPQERPYIKSLECS